MEEDKDTLLEHAKTFTSKRGSSLSKGRQRAIFVAILSLQGLALCESTSIYPFFTAIAKDKGLSALETGVVLACYYLGRSVFSPICGSIVSIMTIVPWFTYDGDLNSNCLCKPSANNFQVIRECVSQFCYSFQDDIEFVYWQDDRQF